MGVSSMKHHLLETHWFLITLIQYEEKEIYGQGYGQQILRSVARKYDGNFSGEYVGNNRYEALIHLTNQKSASKLEFSKGLVNNRSI